MTTRRLAIHCDDPFHEGEHVHLRTFTRRYEEWLIAAPTDDLIGVDDRPYFEAGGSLAESGAAETRERRRVSCECGATLVMRSERLEPLLDQLVDGGVSALSLRRLNLLVSMQA